MNEAESTDQLPVCLAGWLQGHGEASIRVYLVHLSVKAAAFPLPPTTTVLAAIIDSFVHPTHPSIKYNMSCESSFFIALGSYRCERKFKKRYADDLFLARPTQIPPAFTNHQNDELKSKLDSIKQCTT